MNILSVIVFQVLQLPYTVFGFPSGGPVSACLSLIPHHHGFEQQKTTPPYAIRVSNDTYSPSQTLDVTLTGLGGWKFKGVMMKAHRSHGDMEEIIGSFTDWPKNKITSLDCFGGVSNVITQKNKDDVTEVQVKWLAPNTTVGNVTFTAYFVEDFSTFWGEVKAHVRATHQPTETPGTVESVTGLTRKITYDDCGSTKGCFFYPRYCTGIDCDTSVTYQLTGNYVAFEVMMDTTGYVAVGFSDDRVMGNDETITCTGTNEGVSIEHGYNPQLYNQQQYREGLIDMETQMEDGKILCRFKRPIAMTLYTFSGMMTFNLSNPYYVMLAWGQTYAGTTNMKKHIVLPPITENKVDFRVNAIHRGDALPKITQIHGILMLIAWTVFAGISTIVARYFRDAFDGQKLCGTKIWFQVHRYCAVMVFLLSAASFILIFVKVNGLSKAAGLHSYLGITVMCMAAHVVAVVTLFLAYMITLLPESQRMFGLITLGVWTAVQVVSEVVFETWRCTKKGEKG
ncbi:hypothetical protein ScPMuIL_000483 [Solemya velum]